MSTKENKIQELTQGLHSAYINKSINSNLAYKPQFISNDEKNGRKVLTAIENELKTCQEFKISVAFITEGGIAHLLMTLKELEKRGIQGKILTTDYLSFSQPKALKKLEEFNNIEVRMYCVNSQTKGFHTKGYIFREDEIYRIIVGSSNMTLNALTVNKEWNTKLVTTSDGEYIDEILSEFDVLWETALPIKDTLDTYIQMYEAKKAILKQTNIPTIKQYTLEPNTMQLAFIDNLKQIRESGKDRALLISATGTGKTYASAFALRELNPAKALFLVHREQIAKQAIKSYKDVFGDTKTFGLLSGNSKDYEADVLFSTMQMMAKDEVRNHFKSNEFQVIIIDEVHRAGASSYQKIIDYFKPEFWLGMTASPDRPDGFDIYRLFHHTIAYEIRLQKALEENLLCPFVYYGITDIIIDGNEFSDETSLRNFNLLIADDRVNHIIEQARFYGYSGERVKGLIFCSTKEEARILSRKFNERLKEPNCFFKTAFLSGDDAQDKRETAIEKLVREDISSGDYLDYIFTVDIFNEGVDIPEINQVIMLRPTMSPIVFVQQLGRGLRKSEDKEFVIIIDFIANYTNNFMIPIALSGDRSYNKDNLRRYMNEGNRMMPGSSSIHFDEISKKRVFESIDSAKPNTIKFLREEYIKLKNKVGHIPSYQDFEKYGAIDITLIFENESLGSYHEFLKKYDDDYNIQFNETQEEFLKFVSDKIANGKRLTELTLLERMVKYYTKANDISGIDEWFEMNQNSNAIKVLTNEFTTSKVNRKKYENCIFIKLENESLSLSDTINQELNNKNFIGELEELVDFGIQRYNMYYSKKYKQTEFVLYQKYTYEDVCKLLNWDKNVVAQNIGGYKYDEKTNTFPVFINYNKDNSISDSIKYEDRFTDDSTIVALSKQSRTPGSKDVQLIYNAEENNTKVYLFVRKNKKDNISKEFYFLGEVYATGEPEPITMKNTNKKAVEITYKLDVPVREDLYDYIIS